MIGGNREFETYTTQFGVLLGSTEKAQERLKQLADFGASTPFELPEVVRADKVLTGFGLTAEDVAVKFGFNASQIRTIAGDVAAGAGTSFEEMAGYLGKFSSGATGEAISRFQELGIVTREQLAGMGLEFSKSGELLSPLPESMNVLLGVMQKKYGGMMDAQSKTFDGMISNLQDYVKGTLREVGQPIFEVLKDKLEVLLAWLNTPEVKAGIATFAKQAMDSLVAVVDWVVLHWPEIQQTFSDVFTALVWAWNNVLWPVLYALGVAIADVVNWFKRNWPTISQTWTIVVESIANGYNRVLVPMFTALLGFWDLLTRAWSAFARVFTAPIEALFNVGRMIVDGLVAGIESMPDAVKNALINAIRLGIDAVKAILGIASPSKLFEGIGMFSMQGLANGIARGGNLPRLALGEVAGGMAGAGMAGAASVNNFYLTAQYANRERDDLAGDVRMLQMIYGRA
jgi:hypothetical protein